MKTKGWLAFALYLPVFGVLGYQTFIAALVLAHGDPVGAYAFLYAAAAGLLGRRAFAVYRGAVEEDALWKDIAALGLADACLAVIALEAFF